MVKKRVTPGDEESESSIDTGWIDGGVLEPKDRSALNVAILMSQKGMTVAQIVRELHPHLYAKSPLANSAGEKSRHDLQTAAMVTVQRSLMRAIKNGYLVLKKPVSLELTARLKSKFADIEFTVADDTAIRDSSAIVCNAAAEVVSNRIQKLMDKQLRTGRTGPIFVGTCSGRTLSQTFGFLAANVNPFDNAAQLLTFVGMNAAYRATEFTNSANSLACQLAELYCSKYLAVPVEWTNDGAVEKEFEHAIQSLDLLITAAGTTSGFLFRWYQDATGKALPTAKNSIGDIGFVPIDRDGNSIVFSDSIKTKLDQRLRSQLSYERLRELAGADRVLLILAESLIDATSEHADIATLENKAEIAIAIFNGRLASHVVLGARLADRILKQLQ
jgi:hypothetical protein